MERKTLQFGAVMLICALIFRLFSSGVMETALEFFSRQEVASAILFLETGRVAYIAPQQETEPPQRETEPIEETEMPTEEQVSAVFSAADASLVSLRNTSGQTVDVEEALLQPLAWDLRGDEPTVLILHTHGTESYVNTEGYKEAGAYRSLDTQYNIVSIGDRLADRLTEMGISVLHDRTLHDYPSYNGSYTQARETVQKYLKEYPSIQLVLDLHRDAISDDSNGQARFSLETETGTAAQLLLVMGTGSDNLYHPNWRENFSVAVKLHAQLEKVQPGICRPLSLRSSRFNQDLLAGMVLVEMGAAGNTRQEALLSADLLAEAIQGLM